MQIEIKGNKIIIEANSPLTKQFLTDFLEEWKSHSIDWASITLTHPSAKIVLSPGHTDKYTKVELTGGWEYVDHRKSV